MLPTRPATPIDATHTIPAARPATCCSAIVPQCARGRATLVESIPLAYERLVGPLTLAERDRYCLEAAIMEPLLGMPAGSLSQRTLIRLAGVRGT